MNKRIDRIETYINYLMDSYNITISLRPIAEEHLIKDSKLLAFDSYNELYCHYIKNNARAFNECLNHQRQVFDKLANGSFCLTCYAGVTQYIYPFSDGNNYIGYICVGNFKSCDYKKYLKRISSSYVTNSKHLEDFYNKLNYQSLTKEELDIIIEPLCDMLELAYTYINKDLNKNINSRILTYLDWHYRRKITVEELSRIFFLSYSTISHRFKQENGISINAYINNLRINDAKNLLKNSNLTVSEIADIVGFNSINYFINTFTRKEGISPGKFRISNRVDLSKH